jgi:hypothetical protein
MEDLIKCYCGHTTTCDCIPEQEKSYSEKEVKELAFNFYYDMSRKMSVPENLISENFTNLEEWFEQFKK